MGKRQSRDKERILPDTKINSLKNMKVYQSPNKETKSHLCQQHIIYPAAGIICSVIARSLSPAAPDFMGSENGDPRALRLGQDLPKLKLWMRSKGNRIFVKVKFHNFTCPQSSCNSNLSLLTTPFPLFCKQLKS